MATAHVPKGPLTTHIERNAADLAEYLGGSLVGDGATSVFRVDTLEDAGEGSIAWITSSQEVGRVARSRAPIFVIPHGFPPPQQRCSIAVDDPEIALCRLLELFDQTDHAGPTGVHPTSVIHPTANVEGALIDAYAVVEPGATIGAGTTLRPGAYVGPGVSIGEGCVIWNNVVLRAGTRLGDRVTIHANTTIGADGFGYIFRQGRHVKVPQVGGVVIEDDVEIGAGCTIDRAKTGVTRVGAGTKIDNLVQIGHNVRIGRHCVIAAQTGIGGSSTIGDGCALGGQVGISDHTALGDGARIAGKSGISRTVQPGEVMRGIPALSNSEFQRTFVAGRKLPGLLKEFRVMRSRIAALEEQLCRAQNHPSEARPG